MQAIDIDGNYHDVSPDEVSWRVHAYGIVIADGKILLSPQHGENKYDLPGGKIEINESIEQGLKREVLEETGIDVDIIKQVTARDNIFKVTFREPQEVWHSVMVYYLCRATGGRISTDGLDEGEVAYVRRAEWVSLSLLDTIAPAASYDWRQIVKEHLGS